MLKELKGWNSGERPNGRTKKIVNEVLTKAKLEAGAKNLSD